MGKRIWTPPMIAELRRLTASGATYGQAADSLGVTRCAVAGACRRLKIVSLNDDGGVSVGRRKTAKDKGGAPDGGAKLTLGRHCQYIAGKPTKADDCKCGAPVWAPGASYCFDHQRVCMPPPALRAGGGVEARF